MIAVGTMPAMMAWSRHWTCESGYGWHRDGLFNDADPLRIIAPYRVDPARWRMERADHALRMAAVDRYPETLPGDPSSSEQFASLFCNDGRFGERSSSGDRNILDADLIGFLGSADVTLEDVDEAADIALANGLDDFSMFLQR